ncbi:basic amino acid ABC transporter substrate-binding protein [Alicyclobacillus sp. SO9]|uniref:basic amino acid ABC transporter substrate-binding protein n=1 Tax=Alicyclobacillus sp. SO9 TaxID=2665646 RepID=UPI0018E9062B|nr:basic amino acid ABC transporter substrate-binding protein [Alicyclobacillus sp. SO9]QQE79299.1 basic amino acid ABC transporter substrate-binding protein [Alicyclobacillus sp. SO9]
MKKFAVVLSSVALLGLTAVGCGTSNNSGGSGGGNSTGQSTGGSGSGATSFVLGTSPTYPPFETKKNGKLTGFDIEMIHDIAKLENLKIKNTRTMQFSGLIPALVSDQVDVAVAGFTIKKTRMQKVNFSNAYYLSGQSILVRKNSSITGLKDLKGKVVAVKKATTGADFATSKGLKNLKQFNTTSQLYSALMSGSVSAVIFDNPGNSSFAKDHSSKVKVVGGMLTGEYYGIAVSKKKPELLKKINAGLKKMQSDGEYKKLYKKYFGSDTNGIITSVMTPKQVVAKSSS